MAMTVYQHVVAFLSDRRIRRIDDLAFADDDLRGFVGVVGGDAVHAARAEDLGGGGIGLGVGADEGGGETAEGLLIPGEACFDEAAGSPPPIAGTRASAPFHPGGGRHFRITVPVRRGFSR